MIQGSPTGFTYVDGTSLSKNISNVALTSNVSTLTTSVAHGLSVGQWVTITLDPADVNAATFAPLAGTFKITVVGSSTTFSYAKTTGNISSTATATATNNTAELNGANATGLTSRNRYGLTSPIEAGTGEVALTFPPGASGVSFRLPSNTGQLRTVAGGASGGYSVVKADLWFYAPGKVGDVIYISRDGSTTVEFEFDK